MQRADLSNRAKLHFSKLSVYHEIYNLKNRWDKDMKLYHVFAREQSTVTVSDYPSAKKRRDTIMPLFSRKNIIETQYLIQQCVRTIPFQIYIAVNGPVLVE